MAFVPNTTGPEEPGFVGRMVTRIVMLVVVVGTVGFSIFLLAAATGNLDTLKGLIGL